jgi:hypothetical protein
MRGYPCSAMLDAFNADRGVPRSALGAAASGPSMRDLAAVSPADIDKVCWPPSIWRQAGFTCHADGRSVGTSRAHADSCASTLTACSPRNSHAQGK